MYLSTAHPSPGFGQVTAARAQCPSDAAINSQAALLMSDLAPLAGAGRPGCDHKAVWSFVPSGRPENLSVLVYLHGNNNFVTADRARAGGRQPDWDLHHRPHPLRRNGPVAAGPKYEMDAAAQASRQRPVVLAPEDVVGRDLEACLRQAPPQPDAMGRVRRRPCFWSVGDPGAFAGDPLRLGAMIGDCLGRLGRLRSDTGAVYLPTTGPIRRLFLAGHSAGGQALSACAVSQLATSVPTDLWLYDCTYWPRHLPNYQAFAQTWHRAGRLGNAASSSRIVIIVTPDRDTTGPATTLIGNLERAFQVRRARLGPGGHNAAGSPIVEIAAGTGMTEIDSALRRYPVVFIHTAEPHDEIPRNWTPRLLASAAAP